MQLISMVFQNWVSLESGSHVKYAIFSSFKNSLRPVLQDIVPKPYVFIENSGNSGNLA